MMGHLGMGVMINALSGSNGAEHLKESLGKEIRKLLLDEGENRLCFEFSDGSKIAIFDDGQSCCESRYMRTDDILPEYVGATLNDVELRDAPSIPDEYGEEHEVQFLVVKTSKGIFTLSNHNEHNGYYGGFWIKVVKIV